MAEPKYYDGTKLLSMLDINGQKPEIFVSTANRSAGKTTYFSRYFINRYLKNGEKFMLMYRYSYELDGCAEKFFRDIKSLFFKGFEMGEEKVAKGLFRKLFINGELCGYAVAINSADTLKKYSHYFNDVKRIMFDEFMPESSTYLKDEITKVQSIHMSVARGQGEQVRYVPMFFIGNFVTLLNPYYVCWGVASRLTKDAKFLKGDGIVIEQGFNESASKAQKQSGFNRAFGNNRYGKYASENIYLNDNATFVEKPTAPMSRYICTIRYNGKEYGIKEYKSLGIVYCDDKPDVTHPYKIAVTNDDHSVNYIMLKNNDLTIANLKYFYNHGAFRFKDLVSKEAVMALLAY